MTLPKPWQVGQAPNGLLNENSRGCGSSYRMWHRRHSNRSLNSWTTGASASDRASSTANAAPPPSRYAVSIESVSRACASPSTATRSTTTSSVVGLPSEATSTSSRVTARPSTSRRRNPRLARLRSVSRSGSVRAPEPVEASTVSPSSRSAGSGVSGTLTTGISKPTSSRVPRGSAARRRATTSAVSRETSLPQFRQNVCPTRAQSRRM